MIQARTKGPGVAVLLAGVADDCVVECLFFLLAYGRDNPSRFGGLALSSDDHEPKPGKVLRCNCHVESRDPKGHHKPRSEVTRPQQIPQRVNICCGYASHTSWLAMPWGFLWASLGLSGGQLRKYLMNIPRIKLSSRVKTWGRGV